ncbi:MAG: sigma-70 family RNA polymerase sigma factor [Calditrichia bacterium]
MESESGKRFKQSHTLENSCSDEQERLEALLPLVYQELHTIAHRQIQGEYRKHTLNTTALVHEAYLKLKSQPDVQWQNPSHFFAIAARAMRCILVDYARARKAAKRGGGIRNLTLNTRIHALDNEFAGEILALDEALTRLSGLDPRKGQVVEYRFFCGLTVDETARLMELSPASIKREWKMARAWLYRELKESG